MALSARQRQKNHEKKRKKREAKRRSANLVTHLESRASTYAGHPLHECLLPAGLFELGSGSIIVSRKLPTGDLALTGFLVDVHCLGVKDALFNIVSRHEYDNLVKARLATGPGTVFEPLPLSCARKLIEGAVSYARALGFPPHPDYHNAKGIFAEDDADTCPSEFTFGRDGKPFYVQGPGETVSQANAIIRKLRARRGDDGFHYIALADAF
jgi:hypothetical protein